MRKFFTISLMIIATSVGAQGLVFGKHHAELKARTDATKKAYGDAIASKPVNFTPPIHTSDR